jgi:chromosome segregation ATPase
VTVETTVAIISGVISSGAIGFIYKSSVRLEVLERLFEEKKAALDATSKAQDSMDKRVALLEQAITDFKEVIPDLRLISTLNAKLDNLTQRFDRMERRADDQKTT